MLNCQHWSVLKESYNILKHISQGLEELTMYLPGLNSVLAQQLEGISHAMQVLDTSQEHQYGLRGQPHTDKVSSVWIISRWVSSKQISLQLGFTVRVHPRAIHMVHALLYIVFCYGCVMTDLTHILQGYFTGTGAILGLPQCQWSNPEEYVWFNRMNN